MQHPAVKSLVLVETKHEVLQLMSRHALRCEVAPAGLLAGIEASLGVIASVACRQTLLEVAAAGPAAGAAASLACLLLGLGLSAAGLGGVTVEPSAFEDSLLVGILGTHPHLASRRTLSSTNIIASKCNVRPCISTQNSRRMVCEVVLRLFSA